MRPDKQPEEAKQTHASKQQDGGHSKPALYALPTDYPLATSPPSVGRGGLKHATEIKKTTTEKNKNKQF